MNTFKPSENKTFDVNTYETEDLLGILNLTGQAPINKEKIDEKVQELRYKLRSNKKKEHIFKFLKLAADKLKKQFDNINKETWQEAYEHDDSEASKVLMQQYQTKEKNDAKNQILNWTSNIIGRPAQSKEDKIAIQDTVQGDKNPIQRKTIKRTVNFDSHYREILDPSGTTCTNDKFADANPQVRLYTSTNYTVNLNQPLLNVVDITVDNIEIPYSWHVFAEDYGTNRFVIKLQDNTGTNKTIDIIIPSGNYSNSQSLINEINKALQTVILNSGSLPPLGNAPTFPNGPQGQPFTPGTPGLYFQVNQFSNKTIIYVNQDTTFEWYIADEESVGCAAPFRENENSLLVPPKPGNKINYNLGWLLGFRNLDLEIKKDQEYNWRQYINGTLHTIPGSYLSPSTIDIYGPKYFLLTLDDFNNNKPNKDLISLIDNNANNFKLPEYYKPQSMNTSIYVIGNNGVAYQPGHVNKPGYECVDVAGPPSARGCAENDINIDLITNLTKKQQYSVAQMISANTSSNRKPRYSSPNSTDILLRIPVNSPTGNSNQIISLQNDKPEETKRVYFGPVKLRKFNVRLLNDKGFEVNLNDRDWSFSLIVNQLYQF